MVINLNNMKILDASIHRNGFHIDFNVRICCFCEFSGGYEMGEGNYTKVNFTSEKERVWKKWNELTKDQIMSFDFTRNGVLVCKPH